MLRRPLIAGNWKMNGLKAEGLALVDRLLALRGRGPTPFDLLICPPATLLDPIASRLAGSPVQLGAQDCHVGVAGAHTGATIVSGDFTRQLTLLTLRLGW